MPDPARRVPAEAHEVVHRVIAHRADRSADAVDDRGKCAAILPELAFILFELGDALPKLEENEGKRAFILLASSVPERDEKVL